MLGHFIGAGSTCEYNGLFHVSDWFATLLQIASGEDLREDDIDEIVSSYNDTTAVDAIGLWPDIVSQCHDGSDGPGAEYRNDGEDNVMNQTESRKMVISARMCGENDDPDNQYFFATMIRTDEWKLIVNHSIDCENPDLIVDSEDDYWISYDGQTIRTPDFDIYDQYMNNDHIDSVLFRSQCLDEMDESERNENNTMFWYDDIMLFRIDSDAIEACDVADEYPEIVDELLGILFETVPGNYYGSYDDSPTALSALVQVCS